MNSDHHQTAGLYVHIPFCVKKCRYCDFYSVTDLALIPAFARALEREMDLIGGSGRVFGTLYIGGGTPSVLKADVIGPIVRSAFSHFDIQADAEVTLEINPGTIHRRELEAYRRSGINRLSIGVQSFQQANLDFLGRIHSPADARRCIDWARQAGFDNVGLDLIYGLPGQGPDNWISDLNQAVGFAPEHLSCYMLSLESGTPLDRDVKAGRIHAASDDTLRRLFDTTVEFLCSHGYRQYEISNFAKGTDDPRISRMSRHNLKYWSFAPYVGLGPSAHSFIEPERYWNHRSLEKYIRNIEAGHLPIAAKETLTTEQMIMEAIYLGLRTTRGINLDAFEEKFGIDFGRVYAPTIAALAMEDLLALEEKHCRLTPRGMPFLDGIASRFVCQETGG